MVNKRQVDHLSMKSSQSIPIHMHLHNVINIYSTITVVSRSFRRHQQLLQQNIFLKIQMKKLPQSETDLAAEKYGLHIAEENIHDFHFNHTRFVVLSLRKEIWKQKVILQKRKTTLMVKLPEDDRSGVLHQILSVFAWRKLNLRKIESRPLKTGSWQLFFHHRCLESEEHPMMKGAKEELTALNCSVRSLGSYYTYRTNTVPSYNNDGAFFL